MMPTSTQAGKCIGFWILSSVMCVTDINNCTNTTFQKFESDSVRVFVCLFSYSGWKSNSKDFLFYIV